MAWRLFLALALPEDAAAALTGSLAPLRAQHPEARWIPQASLHVTLVFLGWLPEERVAAIGEVARSVAPRHHPFEAASGPAGGNARGSRPGVAWLELAQGGGQVAALAAALSGALAASGLPSGDDRRVAGAHPHLTIARRASTALVRDVQSAVAAGLASTWRSEVITLFRSHLGQEGSRYVALHESPLGR